LPEGGPKTLNGLILKELEDIPETGTSLRVGHYTIEIVHSTEHLVKNARVTPPKLASEQTAEQPNDVNAPHKTLGTNNDG
jgi:Mg2+/Co2+ transporter CorB